jgi:hypothetical protein
LKQSIFPQVQLDQYEACECIGECTLSTCSCLQRSSRDSYTQDGKLISILEESEVDSPIFECHAQCNCSSQMCRNRVVSQRSCTHLEVWPY